VTCCCILKASHNVAADRTSGHFAIYDNRSSLTSVNYCS
jgi:hypothetical protein